MRVAIRDWEVDLRWPRKTPEAVFIRFGLWNPSCPRSLNFNSGELEKGLSVFSAILDDGIVKISDDAYIHAGYREELLSRFAFPVTGRVIGEGSDGEPLLKGVKVLPYAISINTPNEL